jgi:hypothetical protein
MKNQKKKPFEIVFDQKDETAIKVVLQKSLFLECLVTLQTLKKVCKAFVEEKEQITFAFRFDQPSDFEDNAGNMLKTLKLLSGLVGFPECAMVFLFENQKMNHYRISGSLNPPLMRRVISCATFQNNCGEKFQKLDAFTKKTGLLNLGGSKPGVYFKPKDKGFEMFVGGWSKIAIDMVTHENEVSGDFDFISSQPPTTCIAVIGLLLLLEAGQQGAAVLSAVA